MTRDPRFGVLQEALAAYGSDRDAPALAVDTFQAAVALVVRGRQPLELLLIKRARREGDPWSGHMALPGGRRDPTDTSLLDTAVRETGEETGMDLRGLGLHLGRLEVVQPMSVDLPRMSITPHVFGVPANAPAHAASSEVEAVHWVSLDQLRQPHTRGEVEIGLPGGARAFPCLRVLDDVVWGLTYRILDDFLNRAPEVFPPYRGQ